MATITVINLAATCDTPVLNSVVSSGNTPLTILGFTMQNTSPVGIEYEVSTDSSFTNIILTGVSTTINTPVGGGYSIDIPFNATPYEPYTTYVRIRKKCTDTNVSSWSIPLTITSGSASWGSGVGVAPYSYNPVAVIPADHPTPIAMNNYTICSVGNQFTKELKIDTIVPQVGTKLYLTDGITPATPGNLSSFDIEGYVDFNTNGIKWVRFIYGADNSDLHTKVWEVNPITGVIVSLSSSYYCISMS